MKNNSLQEKHTQLSLLSSMESSIKMEKIKSMKKYKRVHLFLYNLVLYSLTSLITLLFFTYPLWIPFMKNFVLSFPENISLFFNAKCLFILGNIIVLILVGESRLRQPRSSPASEIYDEYVARSRKLRSMNPDTNILAIKYKEDESEQKLDDIFQYEEKKKKLVRVSTRLHQHEEKKRGLRASKSEVWGGSGMVKSEGVEENLNDEGKKKKNIRVSMHQHGEKKRGLRGSKSEVWAENKISERVGNDENLHHVEKNDMIECKSMHEHEEKIMELKVSKSEVCGENEIVKTEEAHVENPHQEEEKKKEMRVNQHNHEKKRGLRASKSEVWGESSIIVIREKAMEKKEMLPMATEELNTRVEAFIARVNKRRLFEAKLLQEG